MSNFKFKFEKTKKAVKFSTENQVFLSRCEGSISGVKAQILYSENITEEIVGPGLRRLEAIREEIMGRMSEEEIAGYYAAIAAAKLSEAEKQHQIASDIAAMNENRDKPSH